jgi:hypothetical protein
LNRNRILKIARDRFEALKPKDVAKLSPERIHIAKIFKAHIDKAISS